MLLSLLAILACTGAPQAGLTACSCEVALYKPNGVRLAERVDHFDAVVLATVVRVDTIPSDSVPGMAYVWPRRRERYHLVVDRSWKAPANDTLVFTAGLEVRSSCEVRFRPGVTYLVFATQTPSGLYSTNSCQTELASRVGPVIAALDRREEDN